MESVIQARLVEISLAPRRALRFAGMLQRGVTIPAATGCSLWAFLTGELGISPEYVNDRITTIFLDGEVVDSLEEAIVRDGSVVALSAAMPGLAGATLRRGGFYAAMRSDITRSADTAASAADGPGTVRLKLFNLLIPELGPALLAHGILLEEGEGAEALSGGCDALATSAASGPVLLRVRFAREGPERTENPSE